MALIPHIISTANVTVYIDGQPNVVASGTAQYDLVLKAIAAGDIQAVKDAINVRQAVVNMSQGKITLDGTTLNYDGRPLAGALVNRIMSVVKAAGNAGPLLLFLENLMQNPSKRAVDELYGFLDACDLPITVDGHFLAYKKVNADYTSVHDGKFRNDIGTTPEVPRNSVDEDKDNTCSTGLHFCSESYLAHFGGQRIVVLKINPADVVAIPSDYNNAKGRAYRYEVIGELNTDGRELVEKITAHFDDKFVKAAPAPVVTPTPATPASAKPATVTSAATVVGQGSLTDAQVREIRNLLSDEWPLASIAKSVGTSARTVARIRDGETYTHVK